MKMLSKIVLSIISFVMLTGCMAEKNDVISNEFNPEISSKETEIEKGNDEVAMNKVRLTINEKEYEIELEENSATATLLTKLQEGEITINASEYGGFEKVGSLGFSLPREDKQITTKAGDIVLYQGNQISLFYESNSWSYTKLGKVTNVSAEELRNILGDGNVTLIIKK